MIPNVNYLVKDQSELTGLEIAIKKLSEHFSFSCHPIGNTEAENSAIIARKGTGTNLEGYVVTPFPECELVMVDIQKKHNEEPRLLRSGSDFTVVSIGSNQYLVYHHYFSG